MFAILRHFRTLEEAINGLELAVKELGHVQREAGPAVARLEALELDRHQFVAECEGLLLRADGKLKAAASSEARERQIKKANDKLADPFTDDGEEAAEAARAVQPHHVAGGEAERMSSLHLGLAPDGKAAAVNAKWGR